ARLQEVPLFTASYLIPFTVTRTIAVGSLIVPDSAGVRSLVVRGFTVTRGGVRSMYRRLLAALALPARSVATAMMGQLSPAEGTLRRPRGSVQVPSRLLRARRCCPRTDTSTVAKGSPTVPKRAGVVSLVSRWLTLTLGGVRSMTSSCMVGS